VLIPIALKDLDEGLFQEGLEFDTLSVGEVGEVDENVCAGILDVVVVRFIEADALGTL
jgi:hypothetical protein